MTAQQVRSYKPEPAHFTECAQAHRRQARLGARRRQPLPRRGAVRQTARAGDLGQPQQGDARLLPEEADGRGAATCARPPSCSASPSGRPRRAGHLAAPRRDRRHQRGLRVNCVIVRASAGRRGRRWRLRACSRGRRCAAPGAETAAGARGRETFVIDSPVLPDELRRAARAARAGPLPRAQRPAGHARRLGPPARAPRLPRPSRWAARESTVERLRGAPGEAQRELRAFDEELLIERDAAARARLGCRRCRCPAAARIGAARARAALRPPATPPTAWPCWIPWARVLVAGDYLSPVELPDARRGRTRSTPISRRSSACARCVASAEHVVPGHGPVARARAGARGARGGRRLPAARCAERGAEAELPDGRRGAAQRRLHRENVAAL